MTRSTKVHLVKAIVFPVVVYGCESWTINKAEHPQRIDAFELWCWRRLLRVRWTARKSNQSTVEEISPEYSSEGLMLKVKLQYFGHLMWRTDSFKRPWCWKRLKAREGGNRGLDSWMASSTQRTWVWANSGRWGRTGEPGILQYMGLQSQTRLSDWTARNAASIKISEERHLEASQLVSIGRCWESDRPGEDAEAPCLP